ncbi:MAG: VirE protein [Bacteroidia bacterium]|nr:VirE protein [Bacteroidia bacterium]
MGSVSKAAILSKTHYGIGIYAHVLSLYYPNQTVLSLSGRTCLPTKNPFNADKPTLNIFIFKENVLGNALDREFARHEDSENAIPAGDPFGFAELHYKQSGDEILQTLNKKMNLRIGEKFDFYANGKKSNISHNPDNQNNHSLDIGVRHFSFFKAPVRNTIPHKSISLLDAYNYIVGDYAKQRTEKLRSIEDLKQARQFKASTFDYCTFSGMFQTRNDKALISHSGLLCIDFDHLQSVDLLRKQLLQDEYFETQLLFVSPSGDGIKWIISISPPVGDLGGFSHSNYFAAVANYILQTYGVEVDKSGRDISRACFLPHDPQAYINPIYKPSTK